MTASAHPKHKFPMSATSAERESPRRAFSISSDGKLAIAASETSSKNDFDYLVGS